MTGKRRWRFSFWPMLAAALLLPMLVALGLWQLERGADKRELHEQFRNATATDFLNATGLDLDAFNRLPRFQPVRIDGQYLPERSMLLDNMPRDGRPGHHVLTPFKPNERDYLVIVDRGWRPGLAQDNRQVDEAGELPVRVEGKLAPMPRPAIELGRIDMPPGWPKPVQFPTADVLSRELQAPVARFRLLLSEDATEGFARDWKPPGIPPERHYGYAFQWFALALALIVIVVVMAWPREEEDMRQ